MTERRAPVQAEKGKPQGTIAWSEHVEIWTKYAAKYGNDQTAERIAERHGFGYYEIARITGSEPKTWKPWNAP